MQSNCSDKTQVSDCLVRVCGGGQEEEVHRGTRKILGVMTAEVCLVSQLIEVYTYAHSINKLLKSKETNGSNKS